MNLSSCTNEPAVSDMTVVMKRPSTVPYVNIHYIQISGGKTRRKATIWYGAKENSA